MRELCCTVAFLFAMAVGFSANPRQSKYFTVKGTIENAADGAVIQLYKQNSNTVENVATDTLKNGHFVLRNTVSSVQKYFISVWSEGYPASVILPVWVAPGKTINIRAKDKLLLAWQVMSDIPEQKYQNGFQMAVYKDLQKCSALGIKESYWINKVYGKEQKTETAEMKAGRDSIRAVQLLESAVNHRIDSLKLAYMKTAPVSKVWMLEFSNYAKYIATPEYHSFQPIVRSLYSRLSSAQKKSSLGQQITSYIFAPIVEVGNHFVDATLYDTKGAKHHLAEFSGHYILIDFWSRYCGPCVASLPELASVAEMYKDKLSVVSISEDSKDKWTSFIQDRGLKGNQWNQLCSDRAALSVSYQVNGIPHYVLIDPSGKILEKMVGYGEGSIKNFVGKYIK